MFHEHSSDILVIIEQTVKMSLLSSKRCLCNQCSSPSFLGRLEGRFGLFVVFSGLSNQSHGLSVGQPS